MSGCVAAIASSTATPPPSGMCTSSSVTSGRVVRIPSIASTTSDAAPTTSNSRPSSARTPGEEEAMVVHEEHPDAAHAEPRGIERWTSVPSPGRLEIAVVPPARSIRARIECAIPCRSSPTSCGENPRPRSRTYASTRSGPTSTNTDTAVSPECRAALSAASPQASTIATRRSSIGQSPTATTSTVTAWCSSTRAAIASRLPQAVRATARSADRRATSEARVPAGGRAWRPAERIRPLDQRECLQDRIVQMSGDGRSLFRTDAFSSLTCRLADTREGRTAPLRERGPPSRPQRERRIRRRW